MWSADLEYWHQKFGQRVYERDNRIARLQDEVNELARQNQELRITLMDDLQRQPEALKRWVEQEVLDEAEETKRRAYKARDWAMRQLLEMHMLHHEVERRECLCGLPIDRCSTAQALEGIRSSIRAWEAKQIERARRGLEHSLPYEHPEYRDAWHRYAS